VRAALPECRGAAAHQLNPLVRPTLPRQFILVEVPRLVADDRDLDEVAEMAVDDALGADEQLTDLLAPQLRDHASGVGEAPQRVNALEQLLEPAAHGRSVVGGDVGENLVDLPIRKG
jgi:hypothetical protein